MGGTTGSGSTSTQPVKKDLATIAQEVIAGKWGNGADRAERLTAAGYDAKAVQNKVNQLLGVAGGNSSQPAKKDLTTIACEVIAGKWGNGADRAQRLTAAGYDAQAVQNRVNQLLSGDTSSAKPAQKTVEQIAQEVIAGKWGNGTDRAQRLAAAGYNAQAVQAKVNQLLGGDSEPSKPAKPAKKTVEEIAREVIAGKWGNGTDRKNRLTAAGYDPQAVQSKVNQMLG